LTWWQDAWIRWQRTTATRCETPQRILATTTKRLALNVAQSARARHETSYQPWHPEQVDVRADPSLGAERREALEQAMLTALRAAVRRPERAAYVLREAFDYPYRHIADVLADERGQRPAARHPRPQSASARRDAAGRVGAAELQRFVDAFVEAARSGDAHGRSRQVLRQRGRRRAGSRSAA
jgi:RNA polymerase sigma-70 factor (ECF subfamily)